MSTLSGPLKTNQAHIAASTLLSAKLHVICPQLKGGDIIDLRSRMHLAIESTKRHVEAYGHAVPTIVLFCEKALSYNYSIKETDAFRELKVLSGMLPNDLWMAGAFCMQVVRNGKRSNMGYIFSSNGWQAQPKQTTESKFIHNPDPHSSELFIIKPCSMPSAQDIKPHLSLELPNGLKVEHCLCSDLSLPMERALSTITLVSADFLSAYSFQSVARQRLAVVINDGHVLSSEQPIRPSTLPANFYSSNRNLPISSRLEELGIIPLIESHPDISKNPQPVG